MKQLKDEGRCFYYAGYTFDGARVFMAFSVQSEPRSVKCSLQVICAIDGKTASSIADLSKLSGGNMLRERTFSRKTAVDDSVIGVRGSRGGRSDCGRRCDAPSPRPGTGSESWRWSAVGRPRVPDRGRRFGNVGQPTCREQRLYFKVKVQPDTTEYRPSSPTRCPPVRHDTRINPVWTPIEAGGRWDEAPKTPPAFRT